MEKPASVPLIANRTNSDEDKTQVSDSSVSESARISRISVWAGIIITGQLLLLALALTFFVLIHCSHTPLQQNIAEWGKGAPRGLTFCVTIVATLCSSICTFLFSKGLILFLTSHSNRPTSLINFLAVTSLSRGAAVLSLRHVKWTIISLLGLILLNSLTASFTAILTPTPLIINVPLKGIEFAMNSTQYSRAMNDPQVADSLPLINETVLRLNNQVAASTGPVSSIAAYASAARGLGYIGSLTYLGMPFNATTSGIMPAIPNTPEVMNAKPELSNYLNFGPLKPHFEFSQKFKPSKVFPFNYTTFQQGFSADVTCQVLPTQPTPEQPALRIQFEQNISLPDQGVTGFWRYFVQCPNRASTNRTLLLRPRGSAIVSDSCLNMDYEGNEVPGSQLFIIGGYGPMYSFISPRACQFTLYFTTVEVMYSTIVNTRRIVSRESITPATANIAYTVYRGVIDTATQYAVDMRNKVGDDLTALYDSTSDVEGSVNDPLLNSIMENYFRGVVETRATLVKTPPILVGRGRVVASTQLDLPPEYTIPFEGVWSYETLGWHSGADSTRSTFVGIIPILAVTLITIALTFYAWISLRKHDHLSKEPFDPNNLVTLLKAGRDGSVVDSLANRNPLTHHATGSNVKIRLDRSSHHWHLRPVQDP